MKKNKEFPKTGRHIEINQNPSFSFSCLICDGQQEINIGSSRSLFPVCDKCLDKLKTLLEKK